MTTHPNGRCSNCWAQFSAALIPLRSLVAVSFWVPKFIHRSNFLSRLPCFMSVLGKMMKSISLNENEGYKTADGFRIIFLMINNVITTSLILFKILTLLANFFYNFIRHLTIGVFFALWLL